MFCVYRVSDIRAQYVGDYSSHVLICKFSALFSMCLYCPCSVYTGFLISGLNMLVMMLFFNIFLGSYMVFQVHAVCTCCMYMLYVMFSTSFVRLLNKRYISFLKYAYITIYGHVLCCFALLFV